MKEAGIPLDEILFSIFTNGHSPQERLWAICEGLNRVKLYTKPLFDWEVRKARKKHRCRRGCVIKPGEKYFLSGNSKLCSRCEARLWREDSQWLLWRMRRANKEHRCARGCSIKASEYYFIESGEDTDGLKMCAKCMAMVLFFKNMDRLPGYRYSAWDPGHEEPVMVEKLEAFTGMLPSMWPLDRV